MTIIASDATFKHFLMPPRPQAVKLAGGSSLKKHKVSPRDFFSFIDRLHFIPAADQSHDGAALISAGIQDQNQNRPGFPGSDQQPIRRRPPGTF